MQDYQELKDRIKEHEGFRNTIYDYIAKNRYQWFGKKESCMIPTPELKAKFLD